MPASNKLPANAATLAAFNRDAATGSYLYTRNRRLSATLSNRRATRAILQAAACAGKNVLDLGCGDGSYTLELLQQGHAARVTGVDAAGAAVAEAEKYAAASGLKGWRFVAASLYDFQPDEAFDVAILRGVIHHLPDPARAVQVALRCARRVVIHEPNGLNPVLKLIEKLSPYHREHQERSFLPATIDRWARAAGGTITHREYLNLVPFFCPDNLARLLDKLAPAVEATPLLKHIACGQYMIVAEGR